ncbi:MAG: AAA family ATPase [Liquorilactobacillus hordei]|uniref:AAA family ATPase n=1 Tax=Liquorilactobacillus hordei TaxID=468911 RepID=UPI0039EB82D0
MADIENVKITGKLDRIKFESQDTDFKIMDIMCEDGQIKTLKGDAYILPDTDYEFTCVIENHSRFGRQYTIQYMKRKKPINSLSKEDFKDFLNIAIGGIKTKAIYEALEDPIAVFKNRDIEALKTIKGIGDNYANRLLETYESQKDYSEGYVEFSKWGFTPKFTRKVIKKKGSVELAIKTLKENPYDLMEISGIGFKTIDNKALEYGIKPNDKRRVRAFIENFFNNLAMDGNSYINLNKFLLYLKNEIFECDLRYITKYLVESDKYVVYTHEKERRISTKMVFNTLQGISRELLRILLCKNHLKIEGQDEIIKKTEEEQGWEYSDEQRNVIDQMTKYNVFLLQGLAGTGKSSVVNGFLQILQQNNYEYKQCALSGKAAQNLAGITGKMGSTIHSLLGYTQEGFYYNENTKLPTHAVILDEISMVDIDIFYALLKAIPSGAKLVMIGDSGQLDSIGVGVMEEIIKSKVIPTFTLKKIHRQAQDSAMITHSIAFRKGKYPLELSTKNKYKVYGVKKDLGYTFVPSNESNIPIETMRIYKTLVKKFGVDDTQIITPTISSGTTNCNMLNDTCQKLVNPPNPNLLEVELNRGGGEKFVIRENDRVINTRNNPRTQDINGRSLPIFNGNTGRVEEIVLDADGHLDKMTVDFDGIGRVIIGSKDIKYINLSYAMTVHKSQGSTIKCVIVSLPFQYMLDTRELLYTAITRASNLAYIVTSPKTLKSTVGKSSKKLHDNELGALIRLQAMKIIEKNKKKGSNKNESI